MYQAASVVSGYFRPISVCFYFASDMMAALIKIIVLLATAIILKYAGVLEAGEKGHLGLGEKGQNLAH